MSNEDGSIDEPGSDVPWLDEDEQRAWRGYISGTTLSFRALEQRLLERHGLSMDDYAILVLLSEAPDRQARMSELAEATIIARPNLTYRIRRLEERGIVSRCPFEDDGRGVLARLTDEGFALLEVAARDHVRAVREVVLDPMEREEFLVVGEALSKVFTKLQGDGCPEARRA